METLSRRSVLGQASLLAGALAAAPPLGTAASTSQRQAANEPGRKLKLIVTGGHPGDPEYGCGGTIARYTDLGHEVVLLYLNKASGPRGSPRCLRVAEAKKACDILKARPLYAGQFNSQAVVDPPTTGHSIRFSRPSGPMRFSRIGRSTIMPTIGPSRSWSMTPG